MAWREISSIAEEFYKELMRSVRSDELLHAFLEIPECLSGKTYTIGVYDVIVLCPADDMAYVLCSLFAPPERLIEAVPGNDPAKKVERNHPLGKLKEIVMHSMLHILL